MGPTAGAISATSQNTSSALSQDGSSAHSAMSGPIFIAPCVANPALIALPKFNPALVFPPITASVANELPIIVAYGDIAAGAAAIAEPTVGAAAYPNVPK